MNERKKNGVEVINLEPAFTDERGEIFDIIEHPVQHVGMVTFEKEGIRRGDHYHKKSIQYSFTLSGDITLITSQADGSDRQEFPIPENSLAIIQPGIVHTYVSNSKAVILDMTTESREGDGYEADTVRVKVLQ